MTLKHFTACALLAASLDAQAVHANGTQPSFDCAKATSNAEELVCAEASIAALDRRLSAHYAAAVDKLGALDSGTKEALAALRATQRGWIKGRDECWKSVDLRACVKASYLQREAELVATWLLEDPASVVSFSCDGNPANEITAMFFDPSCPASVWNTATASIPARFPRQPRAAGTKQASDDSSGSRATRPRCPGPRGR